jgi:membrane protease YdiL (CAAX protease family)
VFGALAAAAIAALHHGHLKPSGELASVVPVVYEKLVAFGLASPAGYVGLAAFYAVAHSFLEEYYWRWFVFGELARLLPVRHAILISSVGFMAHHVVLLAALLGWSAPVTWLASGGVAAGGAFWAWLYHRSGSLYGPWLSHLLVDAAIFVVGYDLLKGLL